MMLTNEELSFDISFDRNGSKELESPIKNINMKLAGSTLYRNQDEKGNWMA